MSGTLTELQKLFSLTIVESIEKQPIWEEVFLAITGKKNEK